MPIVSIMQPDYINIDKKIRLRKYDGSIDFVLDWYQDEETIMLVDPKMRNMIWNI